MSLVNHNQSSNIIGYQGYLLFERHGKYLILIYLQNVISGDSGIA